MAQSAPYLLNPLPASAGVKVWGATATSVSGVATFNPTDDGTSAGNALFQGPAPAVHVSAESNTGTFTAAPLASLKSFSGDRKTLTVNVYTGAVLSILGATMLAAPDGTVVHCQIIGS